MAVNDVYSKVYNENYKRVFSFIYKMCRDYHTAEELTQETFYQAYKSIHRFSGRSDISTWLIAIAKHTYFKYLKKNRMAPEFVDIELVADTLFDRAADNPEDTVQRQSAADAVRKIIRKMPEKYRDVVILRVYADLPFSQIGQALRISENSAKVLFFRAKNMMMEELEHASEL